MDKLEDKTNDELKMERIRLEQAHESTKLTMLKNLDHLESLESDYKKITEILRDRNVKV